jgi:hypothetical protein
MRRLLIAAAFALANLMLACSAVAAGIQFHCPDPTDRYNCTRVPNEQLRYEPAVVKPLRILVMDAYYGPPNYGEDPETDGIERGWALKLDRPVDVLADPDSDINTEPVVDVWRVQLVPGAKVKLAPYLGRRVMLEGTLFHSHTAHHHTDVPLIVQKVTRLKNKRPPIE